MRFDKVIAEIIRVQFFWPHTVDTIDTFQILLCIGDIQLIPNSKHCNTQQLCNKTAAQINVAQKVVVSHRQKYLQLVFPDRKKSRTFPDKWYKTHAQNSSTQILIAYFSIHGHLNWSWSQPSVHEENGYQ